MGPFISYYSSLPRLCNAAEPRPVSNGISASTQTHPSRRLQPRRLVATDQKIDGAGCFICKCFYFLIDRLPFFNRPPAGRVDGSKYPQLIEEPMRLPGNCALRHSCVTRCDTDRRSSDGSQVDRRV